MNKFLLRFVWVFLTFFEPIPQHNTLPVTDFGYDKRQPDGYGRYCWKCMNTFSSKRYQDRARKVGEKERTSVSLRRRVSGFGGTSTVRKPNSTQQNQRIRFLWVVGRCQRV